jgi:hypothetical protein
MTTLGTIIATILILKYTTFNSDKFQNDINNIKDKCGKTTEERS